MKLIELFPKTVAVSKLQSLTPSVIAAAIEHINNSRQIDLGADGTYTEEQQLLDAELFADIKQEIIQQCMEFSKLYAHVVEGIGICNSWANVVKTGQSIRHHKHANSYISGSFYLTGGSGFNIVNSDYLNTFGFMPRAENSSHPRAWEGYTIEPQPGDLVLFPAGLQHGVLPSTSSSPRYSVAFNTVPLGALGSPTSLLNVKMS